MAGPFAWSSLEMPDRSGSARRLLAHLPGARLSGACLTRGLLAATLVGFVGCTPPPVEPPTEKSQQQSNLPPAKVDLPPVIKLEGTIPPETHADHTMRIDGLLARRDKYLKQKVLVRGFLVEKYDCPKDAKKCEHPHMWLADSPAGGDKRLMVVALDEERLKKLELGQQYVVTGLFNRKSDDGFLRSEGLLIHESIEGMEDDEKGKEKRR